VAKWHDGCAVVDSHSLTELHNAFLSAAPAGPSAMNPLLRPCAVLWLVGLLGMYVLRAMLALDLGAVPFRVAAAFWIVGGLGYTSFGVLELSRRRP